MKALDHKIPPPVVGAITAAAMWWLASLEPTLAPPAARHLLTAPLAIAGLTFDALGLLAFWRAKTTVNPMKPARASALVTRGVYRLTRNPMYVGMALLLVAWAVHLWAPWPILGPVFYFLYIDRFQIRPEERILRELFGDEYAAYTAAVRRWL